jgi:hypothetical protein
VQHTQLKPTTHKMNTKGLRGSFIRAFDTTPNTTPTPPRHGGPSNTCSRHPKWQCRPGPTAPACVFCKQLALGTQLPAADLFGWPGMQYCGGVGDHPPTSPASCWPNKFLLVILDTDAAFPQRPAVLTHLNRGTAAVTAALPGPNTHTLHTHKAQDIACWSHVEARLKDTSAQATPTHG